MEEIVQTGLFSVSPPFGIRRWTWEKLFLFLAGALASTILLKYGAIQYLEFIYLGLIVILLLLFVHYDYHAIWFRPYFWLALCYAAFSVTAFALSLAALRFDFYYPVYIEPLKQPVLITVARIVELTASVGAMLYMAKLFREDLNKARFTMRVYFWTGFLSGVYSLLSLPLQLAHIASLGAYSDIHRLRGFYNEGGPYGLYVLSVLLVGIALDQQRWEKRGHIRWALAMMMLVFLMCFSKSAMMAVLTVFAINGLIASSMRRRLTIAGAGLAVMLVIGHFVNLAGALRVYQQTSAAYERLSHFHSRDPNFIYGRVAGAYLIPKMIAAHPLSGIGWGNYGTLRNAPEYRAAAVFVPLADEPGLGIFGLAAELGLPLLSILLLCLFLPFFYLRHLRVPNSVASLALLQPIVHLFGAQLNLTYPWVVTAFALGLGYGLTRLRSLSLSKPDVPLS